MSYLFYMVLTEEWYGGISGDARAFANIKDAREYQNTLTLDSVIVAIDPLTLGKTLVIQDADDIHDPDMIETIAKNKLHEWEENREHDS